MPVFVEFERSVRRVDEGLSRSGFLETRLVLMATVIKVKNGTLWTNVTIYEVSQA